MKTKGYTISKRITCNCGREVDVASISRNDMAETLKTLGWCEILKSWRCPNCVKKNND